MAHAAAVATIFSSYRTRRSPASTRDVIQEYAQEYAGALHSAERNYFLPTWVVSGEILPLIDGLLKFSRAYERGVQVRRGERWP